MDAIALGILLLSSKGFGAPTQTGSTGLDQLISVNAMARPLSSVVKQISEKTGVQIRSEPGVGERIMVVQCEKVSAKDLLKHLCSVGYLSIERKGTEYVLHSDTTSLRIREQALAERRFQEIRNAQIDLANKLATLRSDTQSQDQKEADEFKRMTQNGYRVIRIGSVQSGGVDSGGPEWPLMAKLVSGMSAKELAEIKEGQRVVFSNRPTPMQRPFAGKTDESVAAYIDRFNERYKLLHPIAMTTEKRFTNMVNSILDPYQRDTPLASKLLKVNLAVSRRYSLDPRAKLLVMKLVVVDDGGRLVGQSYSYFGTTHPNVYPASGGEVITLSSIEQEFGKAVNSLMNAHQIEVSQSLSQLLSKPEESDPLAINSATLISGWAKAAHNNLVAWLPDACLTQIVSDEKQVPVKAIEDQVSNCKSVEVRHGDGWLEICPDDPARADLHFCHRKTLRFLTDKAQANRPLPLQSVFDFVWANKGYEEDDRIGTIVTELVGGPEARLGFVASPSWLRFVKKVSEHEPEIFAKGGKLPFELLTPDEFQMLTDLLFREGSVLQPSTQGDDMESVRAFMRSGLLQEPTESFPNGLNSLGILGFNVNACPTMRMSPKLARGVVPKFHVRTLSLILNRGGVQGTESRDIEAVRNLTNRNYGWLEACDTRNYLLNVRWSPSLLTPVRFLDDVPLGKRVKDVNDLPEPIRTQLGGH